MRLDVVLPTKEKNKLKNKDDDLVQELLALTYDDVPAFVQKENRNDVMIAIIRIITGGR